MSNNKKQILSKQLESVEAQLSSLNEKYAIQTKRIKFLKKQNEQLKQKMNQSSECSEQIIEQNTTLKKKNRQLKNRLNLIKKQLQENRTNKGPKTATIKDILVTTQTQEIDLPKSEVTDDDIDTIKHFYNLKSFLLGQNQISDQGLHILCHNLTNLRKLFLNNNKITDQGLTNVSKLTQLRCLDIRSNSLTDISMKYISTLQQLTQLSISNNDISDTGIQYLINLKNLRYLDATSNKITNAGGLMLNKMKQLGNLYLSHNKIQAQVIRKLISELKQIRVLDVRFNDVSKQEKEDIKGKYKGECQVFI